MEESTHEEWDIVMVNETWRIEKEEPWTTEDDHIFGCTGCSGLGWFVLGWARLGVGSAGLRWTRLGCAVRWIRPSCRAGRDWLGLG